MAEIALVRGLVAIVDDADFEWLNQWKWSITDRGYAFRNLYRPPREAKQTTVYMHRLIVSPPEGLWVDHRNRDRLDNRRANLRIATKRQNVLNRTTHNRTGYRGVGAIACGRWKARIADEASVVRYLGSFATPEEAARAYDEAARRLHGEFATLNFPEAQHD